MRTAIAGCLGLLLLGCGSEVKRIPGVESTMVLSIYTPPYQDAFDGVSTLRMTLKMTDGRELISNVDIGATEFLIDGSPAQGVVLVLEGVGVDGQLVISSGQSAPFDLNPVQPAEVDLLFARKGEFARLLGDLGHERFGHTATALPDGRVLIFGGASGGGLDAPEDFAPPEIYDLKAQKSCVFADELCPLYPGADRRAGHTADALSGGRVFVFGGENENAGLVERALLFDPETDEFTELTNLDPRLVAPRAYHASVGFRFDDGTGQGFRESILIAGGEVEGGARRTTTGNGLLFDAQTRTFTKTNLSLVNPRRRHTLTAFGADLSRVLVAGGEGEGGLVATAEISDGDGFWAVEPAGAQARGGLLVPRVNHSAVSIGGGVMILGGDDMLTSVDDPEMFLAGASMGTGLFSLEIQAAHQEHSTRRGLVAAQLPSGGVLYAGGECLTAFDRELLATAEVLHVEADTRNAAFSGGASIGQRLSFPAVATLPGGAMVITGGLKPDGSGPVPSGEVWYYNP
jgi:hypothetical protein